MSFNGNPTNLTHLFCATVLLQYFKAETIYNCTWNTVRASLFVAGSYGPPSIDIVSFGATKAQFHHALTMITHDETMLMEKHV